MAGVGAVEVEQALPGGLGHGHDDRSGAQEALEDVALAGAGVGEHGVEDDDHGHRQGVDDVEDVAPVGAAVDAVLVLQHHHVVAVQLADGAQGAGRRAAHQLGDDPEGPGGVGLVEHADDADVRTEPDEVVAQGGGEGGQTALGRWVRAQHRDGGGLADSGGVDGERHGWLLPDGGGAPAARTVISTGHPALRPSVGADDDHQCRRGARRAHALARTVHRLTGGHRHPALPRCRCPLPGCDA